MKKNILIISIVAVLLGIVLVGISIIKSKTYKVQNPVATIQIEGYDNPIKIELDPNSAPNAVSNFIKLANNGFYTNYKLSIEENQLVADSSMEKATLSNIKEYPEKDYIYGIKADILSNGINNYIKHEKGVITMPNESMGYYVDLINTANSQFAILTSDVDSYNEIYAPFGKVVEGMDVLDAIASSRVEKNDENNAESDATTQVSENDKENKEEDNTNKIVIKSITVDTFGIDYGTPEVVNYTDLMNQFYSRMYGGNQQ